MFDPSALRWSNGFAALGEAFYTRLPTPSHPQGLPDPRWLASSTACAQWLGWPADWQDAPDALAVFSGNAEWPGMARLASVYSGHQFGVWAGQLGDGRALWLGEVQTPHGGVELQLKGAGTTPYSRRGDGRAVLRSSIREFLCSEALHHLGVPTTRALALVGSPLPVRRERIESAAVVTRAARSFVRFGHFEHFAHHGLHTELRQLADFVIARDFPHCADAPEPVAALLAEVALRSAELVAHWQALGFVHGVLNTDNLSVLGLTMDFGPFAFLDAWEPGRITNHSDDQGRYTLARQPQIVWWNLHALAQALRPLVSGEAVLHDALSPYPDHFEARYTELMRAKLGLTTVQDDDALLWRDWLALLAAGKVDHTVAWRWLGDGVMGRVRDLFLDRTAFDAWATRYRARLATEPEAADARTARMRQINPALVLRNHLAEEVIRAADQGDLAPLHHLAAALTRPYDETADNTHYTALPPDWAGDLELSCSS